MRKRCGAGAVAQDHILSPLSWICGFCKLYMPLVQGIGFCQDELICRGELMGWTERHKTKERSSFPCIIPRVGWAEKTQR